MKVTVATEVWNTSKGAVAKAVVRDSEGKFLGATNQTKGLSANKIVRPRVTIQGR